MEKIVNSFGLAYRSFFLRDFLTIMVPGFISLLVVFTNGPGLFKFNDSALIGITFGFNFKTLALALIALPVGWGQFYLGLKTLFIKQFEGNNFDEYFRNEILFFKKLNELSQKGILDKERELLYRERLATTKQLAGAFLFTIFICTIVLILKWILHSLSWEMNCLYIAYILMIGYGLYRAQMEIIDRQKRWQDSRIYFSDT